MYEQRCPVCGQDAKVDDRPGGRDQIRAECPRCGDYHVDGSYLPALEYQYDISETGRPRLGEFGNRKRANASGWMYDNPGTEINDRIIEIMAGLQTPRPMERAEKLLLAIEKRTERIGQQHIITEFCDWIAAAWCLDYEELVGVADVLGSIGRVNPLLDTQALVLNKKFSIFITARGWAHLDELKLDRSDSHQAFVAMWFDSSMQPVYEEGFAPAIEAAGYRPHRVDLREHIRKIDDEIIAQIRRSRFLVADFTEHRNGVYYEAGFATGLGLPVFFTCRKDNINDLHFDVRQYNSILWENPEELLDGLQKRIEAVLGRGPRIPRGD